VAYNKLQYQTHETTTHSAQLVNALLYLAVNTTHSAQLVNALLYLAVNTTHSAQLVNALLYLAELVQLNVH